MNETIAKTKDRQILPGEEIDEVVGHIAGQDEVKLRDGVARVFSGDVLLRILHYAKTKGMRSEERMLTQAEQIEQAFRRKVVTRVLALAEEGVSWQDVVVTVRDQMQDDPVFISRRKPFPSARTVKSWVNHWSRFGTSDLETHMFRMANRSRRHDNQFEDIVLDVLKECSFRHDRLPVVAIVDLAQIRYRDACREQGRSPGPHGRKVVQNIIDRLPLSTWSSRGSKPRRRVARATRSEPA